jgi:hypothetical protein
VKQVDIFQNDGVQMFKAKQAYNKHLRGFNLIIKSGKNYNIIQ